MKTVIAIATLVCICFSGFSYQIVFNGVDYGDTLNLQDTLPPGVPLGVYGSVRNEAHQISYDPSTGENNIPTGGPIYGGFGTLSVAPELGDMQSGTVQVNLNYLFSHSETYSFNNFQATPIAYFDHGNVDLYLVESPPGTPVASIPLVLGNSTAPLSLNVNTDYQILCVIDGNPDVSAWAPSVIDPSQPGTAFASTESKWTPSSLEIVPEPGCLSLCASILILGGIRRRFHRDAPG